MYTRTFSTLGCGELTLEQVAELGRRYGISSMELRALGGTIELPSYFARHGTPAELAQQIERTAIRVPSLDTSFKIIGSTVDERATLLDYLPWAEACGARWLRVFDGGTALNASALAHAAETLAWWQVERAARGTAINLLIETHDLLFTSETIQRFISAMPPNSVHLLWDTHHTWKQGGEDPLKTWRSVGKNVVHVHVKDSVSRPSAKHPFTYVLPGAGEFPMAPLKDVLTNEFSGPMSLEWERWWHPYLEPLDHALHAAAQRNWW